MEGAFPGDEVRTAVNNLEVNGNPFGLAYASRGEWTEGLDLVVLNNAREQGAGFETETNRVTLVGPDGASTELPLMSKDDVADAILDRVEELAGGR